MPADEAPIYFEDHEVGERFRFGEYRITAEEIVEFARRYDPQPVHVDEAAARESRFGGLVASGWHTAAMTMKLLVDGRIGDVASAGARGVDDLRWHEPVTPGDVLSVEVETVEMEPSTILPGVGDVHADVTCLDGSNEPVVTWRLLGLVEHRDGD